MRDSTESRRQFRASLERACARARRSPEQIRILAVSKGQSCEVVEEFLSSGFGFWGLGESYVDELSEKQKFFAAKYDALEWHFIGRLQSRKIPEVLRLASVVHGVSRIKDLEALRPSTRSYFLQVNVSQEASKGGCLPGEISELVSVIEAQKMRERCLGLMALPSPLDEKGASHVAREMQALRDLRDRFLPGTLLNMGTSGDFELAISEGADVLRIGTALFGERST